MLNSSVISQLGASAAIGNLCNSAYYDVVLLVKSSPSNLAESTAVEENTSATAPGISLCLQCQTGNSGNSKPLSNR